MVLVILVVFEDKVSLKTFVSLGSVVEVFAGVVPDKRMCFPVCKAWRDTGDTSNRGFVNPVSVFKIGIANSAKVITASGRHD